MDARAEEILAFWFDEVGPAGWYKVDEELDAAIRARFMGLWEAAGRGGLDGWRTAPRSVLALLVVVDQFPRNMFRGDPRSFATDAMARAVAKDAIARGMYAGFPDDERHAFRLPLLHSEFVADQEQGVRRCLIDGASPAYLLHARAHRAVIRRFGRFPFRNAALGRRTTEGEAAWLAAGGYRATVEALERGDAALAEQGA
jgi:uncharacterized protein (DUF924 family)